MELKKNQQIRDYVGKVCEQVRFRDVHEDVSRELEAHIHEIVEEHLAQGVSESEAVEQAIVQMGDADIIGKQLNKVHKPKPEWSILILALAFTSIGLSAIYFIQKYDTYFNHNPIKIFENSLFFALISLFVIVGLYFFDYRKLEKYSKYLYLATLAILVFTVFNGVASGGNRLWIKIGFYHINFVAVSPLLFIIALAGIFNHGDWNSPKQRVQRFLLLAIPLIVMLMAPSISVGVTYIVACIVLMVVSGVTYKEIGLLLTSLFAALILLIVNTPYRLTRLLVFLNPGADTTGMGYINTQLSNAFANSGFWGHGFAVNSQVTPVTLPELHTDFIFAFITYTFGWITSILLIGLIITFLLRIIRIAGQVKIGYAKRLISGFVAILAVQFVWNILMNLGFAPISSVGLPFMSYGGSQLVINAVMIGIILSIYRRRSISESYNYNS